MSEPLCPLFSPAPLTPHSALPLQPRAYSSAQHLTLPSSAPSISPVLPFRINTSHAHAQCTRSAWHHLCLPAPHISTVPLAPHTSPVPMVPQGSFPPLPTCPHTPSLFSCLEISFGHFESFNYYSSRTTSCWPAASATNCIPLAALLAHLSYCVSS